VVAPDRASALQHGHPGRPIRLRGFDRLVVVVGHQAIARRLPAGFLASFGQRLEKVLAADVVEEDPLAPIPSAHEVIHGPRVREA